MKELGKPCVMNMSKEDGTWVHRAFHLGILES
jgi:hypothetical protein